MGSRSVHEMFVCKESLLTKAIKTSVTSPMYNYYKSIKHSRFPFMSKVFVVVAAVFIRCSSLQRSVSAVSGSKLAPYLFHGFFDLVHSSPFLYSALSFVHSRRFFFLSSKWHLIRQESSKAFEFSKPNENDSYDYSTLNANLTQLFYLIAIRYK